MRAQIAFDLLVSFAICAAFALLVISVFYRLDGTGGSQLSGVGNAIAEAAADLNYSILPAGQFGVIRG